LPVQHRKWAVFLVTKEHRIPMAALAVSGAQCVQDMAVDDLVAKLCEDEALVVVQRCVLWGSGSRPCMDRGVKWTHAGRFAHMLHKQHPRQHPRTACILFERIQRGAHGDRQAAPP
jgi:hypothetical protein